MPAFVLVPEEELAGLDRRPGARRRLLAGSFDHGLRQAITVAEMLAGDAVEGRDRFQVQRRQHSDAGERRQRIRDAAFAPIAFRDIAGKQNHDRVKRRTREIADPLIGMVVPGDAENLRARSHALAKFLGERRERCRRRPRARADRYT